MSLFGSLFTGVSALAAQSQSMGMISNNIANVNTVGYKRNNAAFSSMVTQEGRYSAYSPGGVRAATQSTIRQQGILQQTGSSTDAAVSGDGFFVVQRGVGGLQEKLYTRAGSFSEDARGMMKNANGFHLMGWRLDADGNIPAGSADLNSLEPVDVAFLNGLTAPTTAAEISMNLYANEDAASPAPHFTREITVYDSLGSAQKLTLQFTKTQNANNEWTLDVLNGADTVASQPLTFDGNGTLESQLDASGRLLVDLDNVDFSNGSNLQNIKLDITNITQFAADYSVAFYDQNGAELGLRTGIGIDRDGYVTASFSNGLTRNLYKLPLATFTNPNGLAERSGNVYVQTQASGDYNLREAGTSGAGLIASSSLEASNVDLADEFSKMIVTQRAYSAGTKVISTSDQMMQELLSIR